MSAFGTCGLSLGVTSDVNDITKAVLMILMFIGRRTYFIHYYVSWT